MFLASYNPIEVTHPSTTASMASVPVPIVDDDEQTDCEASVSGTPRGPGIFSPKPLASRTRLSTLQRDRDSQVLQGHLGWACRFAANSLPWFAMLFCCEIISVCVSINATCKGHRTFVIHLKPGYTPAS